MTLDEESTVEPDDGSCHRQELLLEIVVNGRLGISNLDERVRRKSFHR